MQFRQWKLRVLRYRRNFASLVTGLYFLLHTKINRLLK